MEEVEPQGSLDVESPEAAKPAIEGARILWAVVTATALSSLQLAI